MPGMFGGSSSSSQTNTATDTGRNLTGKGSRYTESGSFQTGDKSNFIESGGLQIGAKANVNLGTDLGSAVVGGNVTIGEPGLGALFADTVRDLASDQTRLLESIAGTQTTGTLPNPATDLPSPAASDSDSTKSKPWFPLALLAAAALGLWWMFRKRA